LSKTRTPTRKLNFTKRSLELLPARDDGGRLTVFDVNTAGLGFTVFPSGIRSFFHLRLVRGYPRRTTIGRFPDLTVEQARGKASALNSALAKWKLNSYEGEIPFETRRDPNLDDLATQYVERQIKAHSARPDRAAEDVEWMVEKYLTSWRNRKIGSIRKADVIDLHERLGRESGKHTANRVVQMLRAMFYWAEKAGLWHGENPATGIKFFHEAKRTRFLQPSELPRFFATLAKEKSVDLQDFVNLALWTGARRGDVFSMRWENISLDDNRWQIPHPKNRTPYSVPLTPEAIKILKARKRRTKDSPWVFPSRGRTGHIVSVKGAWRKLLERAELDDKDLRLHDLRRTLGSYQAAQGTALNIIGKSLGHTSIAATQIYAQLDLDPIRASVMAATRTIIAGSKKGLKQAKVIELKQLRAGRQ
jgi:integrase